MRSETQELTRRARPGEILPPIAAGWLRRLAVLCLMLMVTAIASSATTFTTLLSFDGTNGADPEYGPLVQGFDGNFYGTTYEGGASGYGTVFKISPGGTLTTLYNFCSQPYCTDGAAPWAGLVLASNGNFYGTTSQGGANGWGTVFKITPGGTLTTLYSFCSQTGCGDGVYPTFGLIQAANGNFYGTTPSSAYFGIDGTVFEIAPTGTLTTLHTFNGGDGESPGGPLVQATNGNFYGTTGAGGAYGYGTVFEITAGGTLTTLHSFDGTDGSGPVGPLVQATNGNFYGTTIQGGATSCSYGCGTIFKMTPGGTLTTLHSFDGTDGSYLIAGLVQATNGEFYGTTEGGGANGDGTVFEITPAGALTTLHSFEGPPDGYLPAATLLQATNGKLYGTSIWGGAACSGVGCGTVFSLSVGLGPLVETTPASGKVGTKIAILGNNLTGSTGVTFNSTAATFTVKSSTEITTTVPSGATTGYVAVTTATGKILTSNVKFRVRP